MRTYSPKLVAVFSAILLLTSGCKIEEKVVDIPGETNKTEVSLPFPSISETVEDITEAIAETTIVCSTKPEEPLSESPTQSAINNDLEILQIINKIRIESNLPPLEESADLCFVAEIRAKEAHIQWSHVRPNGSKVDSLFNETGADWNLIGENLAKHSNQNAEAVVCAWMTSKSHRKNILNCRFKKCGIGEFVADNTVFIALILTD